MLQSVDHINEMENPTPAPTPSPEDVVEALHHTMRAIRAGLHGGGRGSGTGRELTHMDGKVLGFFAHHPGATQKELAQHSGRDKGQLARLIHGLKERGLLAATPDEADRRTLRIELTEAGHAAHKTLREQGRRLASRSAQALSDAERRQLVELLQKLRTNLGQSE